MIGGEKDTKPLLRDLGKFFLSLLVAGVLYLLAAHVVIEIFGATPSEETS